MRKIDEKYQTTGDIQKLDGTPVPEDEPLILFVGHDKVLPEMLRHYNELCRAAGSEEPQLELLSKKIAEIEAWQAANQDKLKAPDA